MGVLFTLLGGYLSWFDLLFVILGCGLRELIASWLGLNDLIWFRRV